MVAPDQHVVPSICAYCATQRRWNGRTHEDELLRKARILCENPKNHFEAWVSAELDYLDHRTLSARGQITVLTRIHDKTGCTCRFGTEIDIRPINNQQ